MDPSTSEQHAKVASASSSMYSRPASSKSLHGSQHASTAKRLYRAADNKLVAREIAALDFLLGIPLEAEAEIVQTGWQKQQRQEEEEASTSDGESKTEEAEVLEPPLNVKGFEPQATSKGRWWEKWVKTEDNQWQKLIVTDVSELERPVPSDTTAITSTPTKKNPGVIVPAYAPGRRLEGDEAVQVQIPLTTETLTKQKSIARQAALREWELETAHGLKSNQPPMLDGRLFFSAKGSYPVSVFSMIRYEPRKEEAALRRQKLEARGGGGTQFVMPTRDWRGVSFRALLPRSAGRSKREILFLRKDDEENSQAEDDSSTSSDSSSDSDVYVPGMLDDPEMVLGRHRTVMIGDRVTGPMVCSTIQFVKPGLLKAELNKQFRERFDGWEPPKSAKKYIGARVVDGEYKLIDPADEYDERSLERPVRSRQGSVTSMSSSTEGPKEKLIRMPPSLTLSKIRSLKQQALAAAVKAKLEIGTVALACVYFERLCLDCRVDKSNRRLSFATCILLASKINEPNTSLVMTQEQASGEKMTTRLQSLVKPNKRSKKIFASLLEFFTTDWGLSLKSLFDAEFFVFAALGFSLHATPSQVAFHFKRLMKTLEWSPLNYLGSEMYNQWQEALAMEEERRKEREKRRERRRRRKEEGLLNLHIEIENRMKGENGHDDKREVPSAVTSPTSSPVKERAERKKAGINLLHRFGMRRSVSQTKIADTVGDFSDHPRRRSLGLGGMSMSPSMPVLPSVSTVQSTAGGTGAIAIDIPEDADAASDDSTIGSLTNSDDKGIFV